MKLENTVTEDLGIAKKVKISKDKTIIVDGLGNLDEKTVLSKLNNKYKIQHLNMKKKNYKKDWLK